MILEANSFPEGISTVSDCGSDWLRYSQADQWQAFLGLHVQSQTNEWTVQRNVKRIIAHADYNAFTYDNDVALMELDADVPLNQYIWPICLPSASYHFPAGREAWITGWGAIREEGELQTQGAFTPGRPNLGSCVCI